MPTFDALETSACPEGSWELARMKPDPRLRSGVHAYRGHRLRFGHPRRRLELPNTAVSLVVNFDGEVRFAPVRSEADAPPAWTSLSALIAGLRTGATVGEHDGRLHGVEVLLAPWMAYQVFGPVLGDLRDVTLSPSDLLGTAGAALTDELRSARGWRARFATLDRWLLDRRASGPSVDPRVLAVWRRLSRSGGRLPIRALADEVGWTERHLQNRFAHQIGLTPKKAARMIRFQRAVRLLDRGVGPAPVAERCGFYDQSHLNREFKDVVALTPTDFLAARRRPAPGPGSPDRISTLVTSAVLTPADAFDTGG